MLRPYKGNEGSRLEAGATKKGEKADSRALLRRASKSGPGMTTFWDPAKSWPFEAQGGPECRRLK